MDAHTAHTLAGKERDQIEKILEHKHRAYLLDLIYSLATVEPHVSVKTFAQRRQMSVLTVRKLIKDGKLKAHLPGNTAFRIPLSAIRDFDRRSQVNGAGG